MNLKIMDDDLSYVINYMSMDTGFNYLDYKNWFPMPIQF